MKTIYTTSILILLSITLFSCSKEIICERGNGEVVTKEIYIENIEGFNLGLSGNVIVAQDSVQRIEITGQSDIIDLVKRDVINKIWDIDFTRCVSRHDKLQIKIFLPYLKYVKVAGSGDITGVTPFNTGDLEVKVSGSGDITLEANANDIESTISGSGTIILSGTSSHNDYKISGSGDIKSLNLASISSSIIISGSGNVEVNSAEKMDVRISGSGDVFYQGHPSISLDVSGSGKVQPK